MSTPQSSDNATPNPPPVNPGARLFRNLIGSFGSVAAGGLLGWLIDSALSSTSNVGRLIGFFLGGLVYTLIGMGRAAGWRGVGFILCIVVCQAGGCLLLLALVKPNPGSYAMLIPAGIGVILGSFLGLALGIALIRLRRKPIANSEAEHLTEQRVGGLATEPGNAADQPRE